MRQHNSPDARGLRGLPRPYHVEMSSFGTTQTYEAKSKASAQQRIADVPRPMSAYGWRPEIRHPGSTYSVMTQSRH